MEVWGMDREPTDVFDGDVGPDCPVHKHPLKKHKTKHGPRWACEFAGCTYAWWGRAQTTPATDRARALRKTLASMVQNAPESVREQMADWMDEKSYTLGTLDEKTGQEACEHMQALRDAEARDRLVQALATTLVEAPEAVRTDATAWLREHTVSEMTLLSLGQAKMLERYVQASLERHYLAQIEERRRQEAEAQRAARGRMANSWDPAFGGRKPKKPKKPQLPDVEPTKTKRRINLD